MKISKKSKDQNSIFIIIIGIVTCIGRFGLGKVSSEIISQDFILIVMAIINYVALGFVFIFLVDDFIDDCQGRISKAGINTSTKTKCESNLKIHKGIFLCTYFLFGILYMTKFKSSELNDILSIFALAISIANNGLVNDFGKNFYVHILNLSKRKCIFKIEKNRANEPDN